MIGRHVLSLLAPAMMQPGCAAAPDRSLEQEAREAFRNCELPNAVLATMEMDGRRSAHLMLPADILARRDEPTTRGRIACVTQWARERGLNLQLSETPL